VAENLKLSEELAAARKAGALSEDALKTCRRDLEASRTREDKLKDKVQRLQGRGGESKAKEDAEAGSSDAEGDADAADLKRQIHVSSLSIWLHVLRLA
jgi:hypothetical protein